MRSRSTNLYFFNWPFGYKKERAKYLLGHHVIYYISVQNRVRTRTSRVTGLQDYATHPSLNMRLPYALAKGWTWTLNHTVKAFLIEVQTARFARIISSERRLVVVYFAECWLDGRTDVIYPLLAIHTLPQQRRRSCLSAFFTSFFRLHLELMGESGFFDLFIFRGVS